MLEEGLLGGMTEDSPSGLALTTLHPLDPRPQVALSCHVALWAPPGPAR